MAVVSLTKDNFNSEVLESSGTVFVDFWAPWCGPCRMMAPIVDELATEYEGKAIIGKLNVDENSDIPAEFGIMSIPTMLFFKNGELVNRHVGATRKADLQQLIDSLLA